MIIEITNPDQAMDVLRYIVDKDYDCETGECAYDITARQDAECAFDSIADLCEEGEDEDVDILSEIYEKRCKQI